MKDSNVPLSRISEMGLEEGSAGKVSLYEYLEKQVGYMDPQSQIFSGAINKRIDWNPFRPKEKWECKQLFDL